MSISKEEKGNNGYIVTKGMKLSNALKLKKPLDISPNKKKEEVKKFHSVQRSKERHEINRILGPPDYMQE